MPLCQTNLNTTIDHLIRLSQFSWVQKPSSFSYCPQSHGYRDCPRSHGYINCPHSHGYISCPHSHEYINSSHSCGYAAKTIQMGKTFFNTEAMVWRWGEFWRQKGDLSYLVLDFPPTNYREMWVKSHRT